MKPPLCDEFVACAGFFSIRFQLSRLSISLQESAPIGRLFSKNLVANSVGKLWRIEHQVCGFSSQKIRSDFGSIGHYTDLAQFLFDLRRLLEETRPHSVVYFGAPSVFRSWCGPLHNFSTCASASVSNRLPDVFSDLFVNEECPKSHQGDSI